jgi:hypothetical protein
VATLDWTLIISRRHLERILRTYIGHNNEAGPHRGLDLRTPSGNPRPPVDDLRASQAGRVGRSHSRIPGRGLNFCTRRGPSGIYIIIGVVVASGHHYFEHLDAVKPIVSAVLAVLLWPLVLFGVNLHLK